MTVQRRVVGRAVATLVVALGWGCSEQATAPGACPAFCPGTEVIVVDTVLTESVVSDTAFRGYVPAHRAVAMQVVAEGGTLRSRGVVRFAQFPDSFRSAGGTAEPIVALDSFRLRLLVRQLDRTVGGQALALHRLPVTVDSATTFDDLEPLFADGTRFATVPMLDTLTADTLSIVLDSAAVPWFEADERVVAAGVLLASATPTFVDVGTLEAGLAANLTRFVKVVTAAGDTVERSDSRIPVFDTYVAGGVPPVPPDAREVGGAPSARSFLRVALPAAIVDSSDIARATLLVETAEPVVGAPGDTLWLRADGLSADFGPKSPILVLAAARDSVAVTTGFSGTIELDVTQLVRSWQTVPDRPRVLVLRLLPEGAAVGEVRVRSVRGGVGAAALRLTYVPLLLEGT